MNRLYLDINTGRLVKKTGRLKQAAPAPLPGVLAEKAKARNALARARTQAKALGVAIERDRQGGYWVSHPEVPEGEGDPLDGGHFCGDGDEVAQAVQVYADFFAKRKP